MSSTISSTIEEQLPAWAKGLSFRLPGRVSRDVAIPRLKSNVFLLFIYVWLRWGIPRFSLVPKRIIVGVISWFAGKETGASAEYGLGLLGLFIGGLILYNIAEAYVSLRYPLPSSKPPALKRKSLAPSAPSSPLNTPTAMTAAQRRILGTPKTTFPATPAASSSPFPALSFSPNRSTTSYFDSPSRLTTPSRLNESFAASDFSPNSSLNSSLSSPFRTDLGVSRQLSQSGRALERNDIDRILGDF